MYVTGVANHGASWLALVRTVQICCNFTFVCEPIGDSLFKQESHELQLFLHQAPVMSTNRTTKLNMYHFGFYQAVGKAAGCCGNSGSGGLHTGSELHPEGAVLSYTAAQRKTSANDSNRHPCAKTISS